MQTTVREGVRSQCGLQLSEVRCSAVVECSRPTLSPEKATFFSYARKSDDRGDYQNKYIRVLLASAYWTSKDSEGGDFKVATVPTKLSAVQLANHSPFGNAHALNRAVVNASWTTQSSQPVVLIACTNGRGSTDNLSAS